MWGPGAIARMAMRLFGRYALRRGAQLAASPEARERLRAWLEEGDRGGDGMFERFDDGARRVIVLAQEEAQGLGHVNVGTEHLLLALFAEETAACRALEAVDLDRARVAVEVEEIVGAGGEASPDHLPFTERAKKVLTLALREAIQLGARDVAPEHILLGILRDGEGTGMQALERLNVGSSPLRREILREIDRSRRGSAEDPPADAGRSSSGRAPAFPSSRAAADPRTPPEDRWVVLDERLDSIDRRLAAIERRLEEGHGD